MPKLYLVNWSLSFTFNQTFHFQFSPCKHSKRHGSNNWHLLTSRFSFKNSFLKSFTNLMYNYWLWFVKIKIHRGTFYLKNFLAEKLSSWKTFYLKMISLLSFTLKLHAILRPQDWIPYGPYTLLLYYQGTGRPSDKLYYAGDRTWRAIITGRPNTFNVIKTSEIFKDFICLL